MPWWRGIICGTRTGTEKGRPLPTAVNTLQIALAALRDIPSYGVAAVIGVLTFFLVPEFNGGSKKGESYVSTGGSLWPTGGPWWRTSVRS